MGAITIYMRPGCHLCEEAEQLVRPLAARAGLTVELIDIEANDELHKRYLELIPVIERDGVELARLDEFRDGRLNELLERD
jgi:glutaredoxin